jgi:hypothetical protein
VNIIDAVDDPKIFGAHFKAPTWAAWRAFLAALFGLPMTGEQLALYRQCTGRTAPPGAPSREAWLVIGRRGGKSFVLAAIAVFLACFKDWRRFLGPGEVATVMVVAADRRQARTIMRYCLGLLRAVPMLRRQIDNVTRESVALRHRVVVEVHTASFRSTRGYTIVAALLDELAFWETDELSAAPDVEVINAIRPGMSTVPGAVLLCASSPHARRGALFDAWRRHHGQDGDPVLVWQAPTREMNPSVPQNFIDQHLAEDPQRAAAEWLAQFRTDVAAFVDRDVVEAAVDLGVRERPPIPGVAYHAFVDPSGGASDSMTIAVAHREPTRLLTLDAVREVRPPFSPEAVVAEFAELLKRYRLATVTGDRFGGEWPRERFAQRGVTYRVADKTRSDLYLALLPELNSRQVALLDDKRLVAQLCGLERRTARGGRDSIDHAPGGHDDLANAVAGAIVAAARRPVEDDMKFVPPVFYSKTHGWSDEAGAVERGGRSAHSSWERWYYNGGSAAPGMTREW